MPPDAPAKTTKEYSIGEDREMLVVVPGGQDLKNPPRTDEPQTRRERSSVTHVFKQGDRVKWNTPQGETYG